MSDLQPEHKSKAKGGASSNKRRLTEISVITRELLRRGAKESYVDYVEYVHEGGWLRTKASVYLCEQVQRFLEKKTGAPYDIMVISMPPQHGKSMTITGALPSFYLGKNPRGRVICISYGEEFATFFGRKNRDKLARFGNELFNVGLATSPNSATEFEVLPKLAFSDMKMGMSMSMGMGIGMGMAGGMISRGILSGVTGRACDLLLIDDPVKNRQEADSELYRRRVYDEWENSFKTRLSAGAKVIIIQTRWHEDDLAGRVLKTEKNVTSINLPCESLGERLDPLRRKKGAALCPELGKDDKWLKLFKAPYMTKNGGRAWNALFQGKPQADEGGILKRSYWRYYDFPPPVVQTVISVDAAFKGEEESDYVAIQAWGKTGSSIYLLDAIKEHLDFPATIREIEGMLEKYPNASHVLIEDKANGSAIIQMLRRYITRIVAVNPQGGKVARVNAVSGIIESGNVYLPKNADFSGDFVNECAEFPLGRHDDQVDCMSQALNRLAFYSDGGGACHESDKVPFGGFHLEKASSKYDFLKGSGRNSFM